MSIVLYLQKILVSVWFSSWFDPVSAVVVKEGYRKCQCQQEQPIHKRLRMLNTYGYAWGNEVLSDEDASHFDDVQLTPQIRRCVCDCACGFEYAGENEEGTRTRAEYAG